MFEGKRTSNSRLLFEGETTSTSRLVFEGELTRGDTVGTFQATPLFGRQGDQSRNYLKLVGFLIHMGFLKTHLTQQAPALDSILLESNKVGQMLAGLSR